MVTVRLFAALREAAGTDAVHVDAGPLCDVLDDLRRRFGEPFASRLVVAAVLVDGDPATAGYDVVVADDAEVALLPPFSGGAVGLG